MTIADSLTTLDRRLAARAAQLAQEIAAAREQREDAAPPQVGDAKDAAELEARTIVADAEVERDLAELRDIGAARRRIEEGSYGTCLVCGDGIDPRRLLAQPQTVRCLACRRRRNERRLRSRRAEERGCRCVA